MKLQDITAGEESSPHSWYQHPLKEMQLSGAHRCLKTYWANSHKHKMQLGKIAHVN